MRERSHGGSERGAALATVLILIAMLSALLMAFFLLTKMELSMTKSSMDGNRGYYAAEAGANLRAEAVRQTFLGFSLPSGTSPPDSPGQLPCQGAQGTGDLACSTFAFKGRDVLTYVKETAGNPTAITIPPGEPYAYLNASEYRYVVHSVARNPDDRPEAALEMHIDSRVVPMFQFLAFFNKDLEIVPEPLMTLDGRIHTNGDLYLGSYNRLNILGKVTVAGNLYRGQKITSSCAGASGSPVGMMNPSVLVDLPNCAGGRHILDPTDLAPWNGQARVGVESVSVPPPEELDPVAGRLYWDHADLRIMVNVNGAPAIEVRNVDGTIHASSGDLSGCGAATTHTNFFSNREGTNLRMLDIDMQALLDCVHTNPGLLNGKALDDTTDGGLVFYFGVDGPAANTINNYAVRVRNGDELASTDVSAPHVRGLTVVTNQAVFVQGHYNRVAKKPAAFLADSLNVLSTAWDNDSDSLNCIGGGCHTRDAANTTINAAFLGGSDSTADTEGPAGQDQGSGSYSGGLHNFPRFHEDWLNPGATLTYNGSFVSLNIPQHVDGQWVYGNPQYLPPNRNWHYDTDFNDVANLPPLSPRFAYIRQELFVRRFEL